MEAIGTFETEYELHLHELRHAQDRPSPGRPARARESAGADGRQAGEYTLDDALVDSFRFNLSRQIVGEVRGKEIWAMIKAMESGTGSISTTHASDAVAADPQARHLRHGSRAARHPRPRDQQARRHHRPDRAPRPADHHQRTVSRTDAVGSPRSSRSHRASGRRATPPPTSSRRTPTGTAVPAVLPDEYRALASHGFDLGGYLAATGGAAMIALVPALAGGLIVAGLIGLVAGLRPTAAPRRCEWSVPNLAPAASDVTPNPPAALGRARRRGGRLAGNRLGPRARRRSGRRGRVARCCSPRRRPLPGSDGWRRWRSGPDPCRAFSRSGSGSNRRLSRRCARRRRPSLPRLTGWWHGFGRAGSPRTRSGPSPTNSTTRPATWSRRT